MIGLYGPETIQWATGGIGRFMLCHVYLPGTSTHAQLFADPNGLEPIENPISSDQYGRLTFYATLGTYDLAIGVASMEIDITTVSGGGITTLNELDDVITTGATNGQVLSFRLSDGKWVPATVSGGGGSVSWTDILDKPTVFTPATHTHVTTDITGFQAAVDARVQLIVDTAPAALDTLNELAAAIGDDANFAGTVTTALAGKQAAGDYATNTALTNGLATKQPTGSYATTGQLAAKANVPIIRDAYVTNFAETLIPDTGGVWTIFAGFPTLSIPAAVGDSIMFDFSGLKKDPGSVLDVALVSGGVIKKYVSSGSATPAFDGDVGWASATYLGKSSAHRILIGGGDLDGGNAVFALVSKLSPLNAGTIQGTINYPFYWVATNLGVVG